MGGAGRAAQSLGMTFLGTYGAGHAVDSNHERAATSRESSFAEQKQGPYFREEENKSQVWDWNTGTARSRVSLWE